MYFMGNEQVAHEGSHHSSAEESISPVFASRNLSYQQATYSVLDQDWFNIKRNISTTFQHVSLPGRHLPVSNFSTVRRQRSRTTTVERRDSSDSLSSTGSIRRSVPGMKKLMPLRLQSSRQRLQPDLSSCLEDAAELSKPHLAPAIVFESEPETIEEFIEQHKVPWTWSHGEKLLHDLPPNKYRETPIYSDSRSPVLCRAYFSEEDLCFNCPPPGTICDELCIVSDYEEDDSTDSQSQTSFADSGTIFDHETEDSIKTSPTSISSRISVLSIQCQGVIESERWSSTSLSQHGYPEVAAATSTPESLVERHFRHWADDDSSRSSSPDSLDDEILSACATPLAPARATMVTLPGSPIVPEFQEDLFPRRPSTPFRVRSKRKSSLHDRVPMMPVLSSCEDRTLKPQGGHRKHRPSLRCLNLELTAPSPPTSPPEQIFSMEKHTSLVNLPCTSPARCTQSMASSNPKTNTPDAVEAICDVLSNFPRDMLFLDTPCIQTIRHLNATHTNRLCDLSLSSDAPSDKTEPTPSAPPPRRYRLRRSKGTNIFGYRRRQAPSNAVLPTPPPQLSKPNLRPLRAIFPDTDDWWRSVLYAHLLAYNFVLTPLSTTPIDEPSSIPKTTTSLISRQQESPNRYNTSPKASRTLGLVLPTSPYLSGREARLEEARGRLEEAVGRVMECMVGEGGEMWGRIDTGFVRTLAEVIRGCEGGLS